MKRNELPFRIAHSPSGCTQTKRITVNVIAVDVSSGQCAGTHNDVIDFKVFSLPSRSPIMLFYISLVCNVAV